MADKKKKPDEEYVDTVMNGVKVRIPRAGMSDTDWSKVIMARDASLAKLNAEVLGHEPIKDEKPFKGGGNTQNFNSSGAPDIGVDPTRMNDAVSTARAKDQPVTRVVEDNGKGSKVEVSDPDPGAAHGLKAFLQAAITGAKPTTPARIEASDPKHSEDWAAVREPIMRDNGDIAVPMTGTEVPGTGPTPEGGASTPAPSNAPDAGVMQNVSAPGAQPAQPPAIDMGAGGAGGGSGTPANDANGGGSGSSVPTPASVMANPGVAPPVSGMMGAGSLPAAQTPQGFAPPQARGFADHPGIAAGTHHPPMQPGDIPLQKHPLVTGDGAPMPADQSATIAKPFQDEKQAILDNEGKNSQAVWDQQRAQEDQVRAQDAAIAYAQRKQERVDQGVQDLVNKNIEIAHTLADRSQTVDPNRYWKSHNKALFIIGAALMGAKPGGADGAIASVHAGIQSDIAAQTAALNGRREDLIGAASINNNMIAQLRASGMDGFEAAKSMEFLLLGRTKAAIQAIASKYGQGVSQNDTIVRQNADAMVAGVDQKMQQALTQASQHRETESIQAYNADTARMAMENKGAGGGDKVKQKMLVNNEHAVRLLDEIGLNMSGPGAWNAVKGELGKDIPLWPTDAKQRQQTIQMLKASLAAAIHGGVLREGIQKLWLGDPEHHIKGLLDAADVGLGGLNRASLQKLRAALMEDAGALREGRQPSATPGDYGGGAEQSLASEQPAE